MVSILASSCTPPNVNTACKPSSGAIPKKQSTQRELHKADDQEQTDTGSEVWVVVAEDYNQLPGSGLDTTRGERTEKMGKKCRSLSNECPPQSLPPPEDNTIKDIAKGSLEKYSEIDLANEFNRLLLNAKLEQSNSCPKRPQSSKEVCSKQNHSPVVTGLLPRPRVKDSMAVVYGGVKESGCPAENDEVTIIV